MENSLTNYVEWCKGMYSGFTPEDYDKMSVELQRREMIREEKHEAMEKAIKTHGSLSSQAISAHGEFEDAEKAFSNLEKAITTGAAFTAEGIEYINHFTTAPEFSVADYCGRFMIDKNRLGFSVEKYNDTEAAQIVSEGEEGETRNLLDYMYRVESDSDEAINFEDILSVPEGIYNDDTNSVRTGRSSVYNKHRINAENKAIFDMILRTKTAVDVDAMTVQAAINSHLIGKAKRGAEIWTNAIGFAALDQVDSVSGVSLITRNAAGDFVYRNKYIVREFSNENLPNNENGQAPVLIGDFQNIVRMAVVSSTALEKTDLWAGTKLYRKIDKEIPVLTTTDDSACLVGYITA